MEEMDFYLSRCIKNWAATKRAPIGGRARLLEAASSPPVQRDRQIVRFITYVKVLLLVDREIYPEQGSYLGPFTQSRAWSFHFAANWRWAI
jgi:hypothetical protein